MSALVLEDVNPRARKRHVCGICLRKIEPGETYRRTRAVTDDGAQTWKTCTHCDALFMHILAHDEDARYFADEGLDLVAYISDYGSPKLRRAFQRKWRGLSPADVVALLPFGTKGSYTDAC